MRNAKRLHRKKMVDLLNTHIKSLRLSLTETSSMVEMDVRNLDRILKGKATVSLSKLESIARALGVHFSRYDLQYWSEVETMQLEDVDLSLSKNSFNEMERLKILRTFLLSHADGTRSVEFPRKTIGRFLLTKLNYGVICDFMEEGLRFIRLEESGNTGPSCAVTISDEVFLFQRKAGLEGKLIETVLSWLQVGNVTKIMDHSALACLWRKRGNDARWESFETNHLDEWLEARRKARDYSSQQLIQKC